MKNAYRIFVRKHLEDFKFQKGEGDLRIVSIDPRKTDSDIKKRMKVSQNRVQW